MCHFNGLIRLQVRPNGDAACTAQSHHRNGDVVVAAPDVEVHVLCCLCKFGYVAHVAGRFLDACDVVLLGEFRHDIDRNVDAGSARNVVDDNRNIYRVCYVSDMVVETRLVGFVVVR